MTGLELYALPGCPYCLRVKWKLRRLGLEYETHSVASGRRDREEVYEASGQYRVPVLVDREHGVEGMAESGDIVRYLERTYGDGESSGLLSRLSGRLGSSK